MLKGIDKLVPEAQSLPIVPLLGQVNVGNRLRAEANRHSWSESLKRARTSSQAMYLGSGSANRR
jgi:hypothetical protein